MIPKRKIPNSHLNISEVSFGCMSIKPHQENSNSLVKNAFEAGINLFDTADLYDKGENEKLVGTAVKSFRKEIYLSTKVGNQWKPDGSGWDWNPRKEYILSAIDQSLKRLQTDYIDLYLLHGGTMDDPFDETIEAFERLIEMGKIRNYGLSSIRPNVIKTFAEKSNICAVMTQYSFLDRRPEEETLQFLQERQIGILARGTIASGLLVDKPAKEYLDLKKDDISEILQKLKVVSPSITNLEKALKYVLYSKSVTTAVAGIRTQSQLNEFVKAASTTEFTESEYQLMQQIWEANTYSEHR